ncbi:hypothetical protein STAS_27350 [Striga asiatica]|uniref:Uncharacterized protein n=1 Tax=Striga asiatica TaxID=4170 RepID=A0A5A7QYE7_STRAF|nr:hypothetical protein STAS_27350 [Striga asiatica]
MVWKLHEKKDMDPPERPKKYNRRKGEDEAKGKKKVVETATGLKLTKRGVVMKCSICKQPNHNSRGCHKNPQSRPTNQGLDVPAATTNGKESQTNKQSHTEPVISGKGKRNKRGFEGTSTGFEGAPNGKRKKNKEKGLEGTSSGVNVPVVVTNATSSAPNGERKSASSKSKLNIFTQEKRMTRSSTPNRSKPKKQQKSTTKPPVTSSQTSANQVPPKEPPPKRVTKRKESQTNKQSQTEPVVSGKGKRNKRGFEGTSTGFEGAPNGKRKKNKEKGLEGTSSGVNVSVVVTYATSSALNGERKSASSKSKLNIFTQEKRMTRSSTCGKPKAFTQPIGQNPRSSKNNVRFSTTKPPVTSSQTSANQVPPKEPPPKRVTRSSTFSPKKSQQK